MVSQRGVGLTPADVSDKYAGQKEALLDVPKGGRFVDMVTLKGDKEVGDKMNKIIAKLAAANDLKGVTEVADFNDADKRGKGQELVDRLADLVAIFDSSNLDLSGDRAEGLGRREGPCRSGKVVSPSSRE